MFSTSPFIQQQPLVPAALAPLLTFAVPSLCFSLLFPGFPSWLLPTPDPPARCSRHQQPLQAALCLTLSWEEPLLLQAAFGTPLLAQTQKPKPPMQRCHPKGKKLQLTPQSAPNFSADLQGVPALSSPRSVLQAEPAHSSKHFTREAKEQRAQVPLCLGSESKPASKKDKISILLRPERVWLQSPC